LPGQQAGLEADDVLTEIGVVDNCLGELKIWSLHGIPFCGTGRTAQHLSVDRIRTLDEARRGAVKMPALVPELVEAGLRSRSTGQSERLLPKTTTEDRNSPRRASAFQMRSRK
jgi:hypothetical protein